MTPGRGFRWVRVGAVLLALVGSFIGGSLLIGAITDFLTFAHRHPDGACLILLGVFVGCLLPVTAR